MAALWLGCGVALWWNTSPAVPLVERGAPPVLGAMGQFCALNWDRPTGWHDPFRSVRFYASSLN